jgi:hypothetical protein
MPALASDLRKQLENVCVQARDVAEAAARSALQKRAVDAAEPFSHFTAADKELRNRLRARGRQVGDVRHANKTQAIDQLTQELAYEYWHRMLFARFLAENHLLMRPDEVAVSLEECEELARSEGAPNGYVLAARYASRMLPQVFRTDDVLLEIEFAPEHRLALEKLLVSLPRETFLANDSLGWVYQFWQTKKKDEVNKSGEKIDGRTLPAVTQLFTEHYMVQFLLHNTIGAWWCARHGINGPPGGAGVPAGKAPAEMEYLRWREDGTPAAGTFDGWPRSLKEFTMLDPCCGSGHFLVAAFNLLVPLRMHDEELSASEACDAVLRENLFGLELDPRCTQIAAFALAVAAWKYPGAGGYRELPRLNIACSGQAAGGERQDWQKLANGNRNLQITLGNLYDLFQKAPPHLGSLLDPRSVLGAEGITGSLAQVQPLLATALSKHAEDADLQAVGVAAQGIATAANLLARHYTLVTTNVPYLGRGKQADVVKKHLEDYYPDGKADLATAFVLRCLELCQEGCNTALVTPQNWLFLPTYKKLREKMLKRRTWNLFARLGPRAFETISGEVVNVTILALTAVEPGNRATMAGLDVSEAKTPSDKKTGLTNYGRTSVQTIRQEEQLRNPDAVITFSRRSGTKLLNAYARTAHGQGSFDSCRFEALFWELPGISDGWVRRQSTTDISQHFAGCHKLFRWEDGVGQLADLTRAKEEEGYSSGKWKAGVSLWGNLGVLVNQMDNLSCSIYLGHSFDENTCVITPAKSDDLPAVWMFCSSDQFEREVRKINQKVNVNTSTLAKVPFDLDYWQAVAAEKYPNGLPEPHSDDLTQWLFKGDIAKSTDPLQVAVARLLGYRWPDQPAGPDAVDRLTASNGIVCLPGVRGEPPGAERLLGVLRAGYGNKWSDAILARLLTDTGCKAGTALHEWLTQSFFEQHCKRFHNRPFIWHIWDGRKDGFSCFVNYHKLNHKLLENLIYSYLQDWITAQAADAKAGKTGADLRLDAAQKLQEKLKLILAGEPPYDIFVRWKPLSEQPIGWNPDLNDGVRMNIRPFVESGILRKTPNIKWTKDRGKEPERDQDEFPWFWKGDEFLGDRVNDVHLSNVVKQAARR